MRPVFYTQHTHTHTHLHLHIALRRAEATLAMAHGGLYSAQHGQMGVIKRYPPPCCMSTMNLLAKSAITPGPVKINAP